MTLVSEIVRQGFREGNMKAVTQPLTAAEEDEAFTRLKSIVASVYGNEAGDDLQPFPIGSNNINSPPGFPGYQYPPGDWFLPLNMRVMLNLTQAYTFDLHPMPQDGSRFEIRDESNNLSTFNLTIRGNGRLLEGATSQTFSTDGFSAQWFYRADLGDWVRVAPLALIDTFPFPEAYDDMFICLLAMRLSPRYGRSLSKESGAALERSRGQFRARYSQTIFQPSDPGLLSRSVQTYNRRRYGYGAQPYAGDAGYPFYRGFFR